MPTVDVDYLPGSCMRGQATRHVQDFKEGFESFTFSHEYSNCFDHYCYRCKLTSVWSDKHNLKGSVQDLQGLKKHILLSFRQKIGLNSS